jgi:predicted nuclease with RNAse H fold
MESLHASYPWAGIDYGSKMAGTTVIAWVGDSGQFHFRQSAKKRDADTFLLDWADQQERPGQLFLDAPLSLPGVYRDPGHHSDYFYRAADKEVQAMSPMFLGGLTARAMRLVRDWRARGWLVHEVYPGHLARSFNLKELGYKKKASDLANVLAALQQKMPGLPEAVPGNWHQFDALLAFCSGWRYQKGQHFTYGDPEEGLIIV